jgi:hypothetical protein
MSYKYRKPYKSKLGSIEKLEGEPIEHKIERILNNKEPIKDGAPDIFQDRGEGVLSAYNIRTDRWEIAADGMDLVQKNIQAKRDGKAGEKPKKEGKVVEMKPEVTESKKIDGTNNKK